MDILGIIPARGGSKGIPGKNVKQLGRKPLIQYTIEAALDSEYITDLVVSTEDEEIAEISRGLNANVPSLRPLELATDESPTIDTVIYTLKLMMQKGKSYDLICLLQPTTPFRKKGFIDAAIKKYIMADANSLISVLPVPHQYNPHWVFEPNEEDFLSLSTGDSDIIPRRQELPRTFIRDGSIYLTSSKVLLEEKSLFGNCLTFIEADEKIHVNLDTMEDWGRAERIIKTNGVGVDKIL